MVIARWLNHQMRVLIFDEPTRGIDVGAKAEIYALMREFTARGHAIIMISSELPELIGLCDRVLVVSEGRITGELTGPAITERNIMTLAAPGALAGSETLQ